MSKIIQDIIVNKKNVNLAKRNADKNLAINIYDVESQTLIKSKNTINSNYQNINGFNRVSVKLKNYQLNPGKYYLLKISDTKYNYYINFKITKGYEK